MIAPRARRGKGADRPGRRPVAHRAAGRAAAMIVLAGSVVLAGCGDGAAGAGAPAGESPAPACEAAERLFALPDALVEASGMALDPRREDLLWLHNDSGNEAELFGVTVDGAWLSRVALQLPANLDAEDLAEGPCGEARCLYYGDIGDNFAVRPDVVVYRLPLPPLPPEPAGPAPAEATLAPDRAYRLLYPDGPRDAEALFVDGPRRQLLVASKGREALVSLYAADFEALERARDGTVTLHRLGRLRVPIGDDTGQFITAGDMAPGADRFAVRSYTALFVFRWEGAARFDTLAAPLEASLVAALEPQGEGLAFGADPRTLYLASEARAGRLQQMSRIRCTFE